MNCQLTDILTEGIGGCKELSVGGLQSIYLFPFGDLYDYAYTDNNTSFITNYRQLSVGVDLQTNKQSSSFSESLLRDNVNVFEQTLSTVIPKLSESKRGALEALLEYPLTVIAKDRNGKCWILGQDSPLKVDVYTATSGTSDSSSEYAITLSGQHRSQIRRIACPDIFCGVSANDLYLFNSAFDITDFYSSYTDGSDFELQVNDFTLDGNLRPFEPVLWYSDPTVLQRDYSLLQAIIGGYGTLMDLQYDAVNDIVSFVISSSSNVFPSLSIENIQYGATIDRYLNLLLIGGVTQLGSIVTVQDETSTLYSAPFGSDITTGNDLYGTSNNAFIALQPYTNGQTFTIQTNSNCGLSELTVSIEGTIGCLTEFTTETLKSYTYSFEYRKSDCDFDFTATQFHFNGITALLFPTLADWNNDLQLFTDELVKVLSDNPYADENSLIVTDAPTVVTVQFNAYVKDADLFVFNWRGDTMTNRDYQKTIGIFNTFANNDAEIFVSSVRGSYEGLYGQYPIAVTNLYNILEDPNLLNHTNNLGLELDVLAEDDIYDALIKSVQCPDSSYQFQTKVCTNDVLRENVGTYKRFILPFTELNKTFKLGTNTGDIFFFCSNPITPTNVEDFGIAIEQQLSTIVKLLNIQYNWFKEEFHIELLELDPSISINDLECDFGNTIATDSLTVWNYRIDPVLHPNALVNWSFPTNCANWVYSQDAVKNPLEDYKWESTVIANFINNVGGTNLFDVNLRSNTATQNGFTVRFHVGYPTLSNIVDTLVIATPNTTGSIDIQANPDYNNITHISFSMGSGMCLVVEWNSTMSNVIIDAEHRFPIRSYWGNYGSFFVLAEPDFDHRAYSEVNSSVCPIYRPDASYWFNPRKADVNSTLFIGGPDTLRVTEGSKMAIYAGTSIQKGDVIRIDNSTNYYVVSSVSFPNVILHADYRGVSNIAAGFDKVYFNQLPNSITPSLVDAIINSPAEAPTFVASSFQNGIAHGFGLRFNATQYYAFTSTFDPTMIFAASISYESTASIESLFAQAVGNIADSGKQRVSIDGTSFELEGFVEDDTSTSSSLALSLSGNDVIVVFSYDVATSTITLALNGTEISQTGTIGTFNNIAATLVGADYDGAVITNPYNGTISEFIIDEDNTFDKRRLHEGYLAWQCGLEGELPSSHPYKHINPKYNIS